jgi:type III secretion system chaperone SycN
MTWADDALGRFGQTLGIEGLSFDGGDSVRMEFEASGALYFERLDEEILIYLVRELERPDVDVLARALALCHWRHNHPFPVHAGLHGERQLAFAIRIPQSEFDVPTIERVISFLRPLHDAALDGARL